MLLLRQKNINTDCLWIHKTRVSAVADCVLKNATSFYDSKLYYNKNQKCLYFEVYGVIFSFHQIKETKQILIVAANNPPITWTGVRLQRIAQNIFLFAKEQSNTIQMQDQVQSIAQIKESKKYGVIEQNLSNVQIVKRK